MRPLNLNKGEKIILRSQCTLWIRDSWLQGYLILTNRRLVFDHITKQTFETSLNDITELSIEKRVWFFGVRVKQLCIDFNSERKQKRVYITLAKPKKWNSIIKESIALMLAERWGYNGANTEYTNNT